MAAGLKPDGPDVGLRREHLLGPRDEPVGGSITAGPCDERTAHVGFGDEHGRTEPPSQLVVGIEVRVGQVELAGQAGLP